MAQPLPKDALDTALHPDRIGVEIFETTRRGYNPYQVSEYLAAIAEALRDAQQREAEMRSRLGKAVRRAEAAEKAVREAPSSDLAELNRQVGDDVAAILDAARSTGQNRISTAEKSAEGLISKAKAKANEIRGKADAFMNQRRSEAEVVAADIVGEGHAEADAIIRKAKAEASAMRAAAVDRVAQSRDECDRLIHEAEEARAQILEDMARRRRDARAQVERLRVGRDRLLRSYEVVRRTLDETTVELKSSLREAKVRGDSAARAVVSEPLPDRHQLELELADAKMIGRVRISELPDPAPTDPAPTDPPSTAHERALRSPALPRPLDPPRVPNSDSRTESAPTSPGGASGSPLSPQAPAVAPVLRPTLADATADDSDTTADADANDTAATDDEADKLTIRIPRADDSLPDLAAEPVDPELAELTDEHLAVVDVSDEVEQVVALVPFDSPSTDGAAADLFKLLRLQRGEEPEERPAAALSADATTGLAPSTESLFGEAMESQREAVITEAARELEERLRVALADEQDELLAGIRAAKNDRERLPLTAMVGDEDAHLRRYVVAINEIAAVTYGAGADLVDATPTEGGLPAGAVEELLIADVVEPIRHQLESLDASSVGSATDHTDPLRSFYTERKTDHLPDAATRLARLLCVAGVCDSLPADAAFPWAAAWK